MSGIDWTKTQMALKTAGFDPKGIDGKRGPGTYGALLGYAARRQPDINIVKLAAGMAAHADLYEMETVNRLGEFVAQTCNESGGYSTFVENLNYSAAALAAKFGSHGYSTTGKNGGSPTALAIAHARHPILIANHAYANREGNGDEASGDGWRYRGRDPIQSTFKNQYVAASKLTGLDCVGHPELLEDPSIGIWCALDYWKRAGVNAYADKADWLATRGITNTGSAKPKVHPNGLEEVAGFRNRIFKVLIGA